MTERFSRQSFLGPNAEQVLGNALVGVVGLGGGGSHIVQQLAHLGVRRYVLYDADVVEESNLNRLVGATLEDARAARPKLEIAKRIITGQDANAEIHGHQTRWQESAESLRLCDLVFSCVDSFAERAQLEIACRRHLIPMLDIGLGVTIVDDEPPVLGGQVILSMPGGPCMRCLGFLTEKRLADEASQYGDAGPRPQVIWGNGVLASIAVGIAIDLLTDWTRRLRKVVYLEYRGNEGTVRRHPRLDNKGIPVVCPHYPPGEVGDPVFKPL
jgi:molybdopterin/thiamine biosynthesis adenylyltransferase